MHERVAPLRADLPLVAQFSKRRLTWWPEIGIGWYPVEVGIEP